MNDNAPSYQFENRKEFRVWLESNHNSSNGIWVTFNKGSKKLTSSDALEEAICFGWIDGLMKSIDEIKYRKYFSRRKNKENWSEKNKLIYKKLKEKDLITDSGIEAYQVTDKEPDTIDKNINFINISRLKDALRTENGVLELFDNTLPSRKKQLAGFYCDAKTDETREKRRMKIVEALRNNYKGMLY